MAMTVTCDWNSEASANVRWRCSGRHTHVIFDLVGHVVVDDMLDVGEVQPLGRHVRRHQHVLAPALAPTHTPKSNLPLTAKDAGRTSPGQRRMRRGVCGEPTGADAGGTEVLRAAAAGLRPCAEDQALRVGTSASPRHPPAQTSLRPGPLRGARHRCTLPASRHAPRRLPRRHGTEARRAAGPNPRNPKDT